MNGVRYSSVNSARPRSRWLVAAIAGVAALATTSCGSSSTPAGGQSPSSSAQSGSSGHSMPAADIQVVASYLGVKPAGRATGTPIKIGGVSSDAGPQSDPAQALAWRNAIQLINTEMGGVQGHPLELALCDFGASAQQGQICGSRFANDSATKAVLFTGGNTGAPEMVAANNGSKAYFCTAASPGYTDAKNMFCTQGGALTLPAVVTYVADYVKAKSVSLLSIGAPALQAIINSQAPVYSKTGIKTTTAFSPPGATSVTSTLVAGKIQSTEAAELVLPAPSFCPPYVNGIKTLGVKSPVISLNTCLDPSVVKAVGIPSFTFLEAGPSFDLPDPTGQTQVFRDAANAYGDASGANSAQAFGTVLLMVKIMNEIGADHLTTEALSAKMSAYTDGLFLGDPALKFGVQPYPSVGSVRARFFTHHADGTWTDATGGKWVG